MNKRSTTKPNSPKKNKERKPFNKKEKAKIRKESKKGHFLQQKQTYDQKSIFHVFYNIYF